MNNRIKELAEQSTEEMLTKVFQLTCVECAITESMQPCEACPNREAQGL